MLTTKGYGVKIFSPDAKLIMLIVVPTPLNKGRGEGGDTVYQCCDCHPLLSTMWGWVMRDERPLLRTQPPHQHPVVIV